jgi:hypothetical protein
MNEEKQAEAEKTVPYARFSKVVEQRAALEARIAELEAEGQRLSERAATADTLAKQLEAAESAAKQATQGLSEYQAAARIGVTDPELYEAARWAYSRMPEADRPAFADALNSWKEDPSAAPLVLRPHLAPPQAEAPAPAAPQAAPVPNPNQGAQAFDSAPQALDPMTMSAAQYRQHRDRFKGTSVI